MLQFLKNHLMIDCGRNKLFNGNSTLGFGAAQFTFMFVVLSSLAALLPLFSE